MNIRDTSVANSGCIIDFWNMNQQKCRYWHVICEQFKVHYKTSKTVIHDDNMRYCHFSISWNVDTVKFEIKFVPFLVFM